MNNQTLQFTSDQRVRRSLGVPRAVQKMALVVQLLGFVLTGHFAVAQLATNSPPSFDVGGIPPQVIWHGNTAEFYVRSDELGSGATFTLVASPAPVGAMALDPVSGHFTYAPAAQDKEHFTVSFQAAKTGRDPVLQVVSFDPMPHLPAEQEVFGLAPAHALPDGASVDYITRSEVLSEAAESFNYVTRQTRTVSISGKTLVLELGHANGLYDTYNEKDDIKALNLYAETVIVRDALRLPQTTVTIYAKELRFEDRSSPAAKAAISTTPRNLAFLPIQNQNGQAGLNGGPITVHVQNLYSAPGFDMRFVTDGGMGQAASEGTRGINGTSVPIVLNYPGYSNIVVAAYDGANDRCDYVTVGAFPGNGQDAVVGGQPGPGGNAGSIASSVGTSSYSRSAGGAGGARTVTPGGAAGQPNPSYFADVAQANNCTIARVDLWPPYFTTPGQDAIAPQAASGGAGANISIGHGLSWLTPYALRMVVAHARDAYLYGYPGAVESSMVPYRDYLTNYQARAEWNTLPAQWRSELQQLQSEIAGLLYRLDSHLDYFSNPAGWVPMLSFEVSKLAFEGEIERAVRVMYLNYWVSHAAATLTQKADALTAARQKLKDEIGGYVSQYSANAQLVPVLHTESLSVSNDVQQTQASLYRSA